MSCDWEGNQSQVRRRTGYASGTSVVYPSIRAHGLRKEDKRPVYTPRGVRHTHLIVTTMMRVAREVDKLQQTQTKQHTLETGRLSHTSSD